MLQAYQGYDQYTGSSKYNYQCHYVIPQNFVVNCNELKLAIDIKILVFVILLFKNQKKAIYDLLFLNRCPNWEAKQHNRSVSQNNYLLGVRWLGKAIARSRICLK